MVIDLSLEELSLDIDDDLRTTVENAIIEILGDELDEETMEELTEIIIGIMIEEGLEEDDINW